MLDSIFRRCPLSQRACPCVSWLMATINSRLIEWQSITASQSFFMSTTVHLFTAAASSALSSLPKCECAVVGVFALGVGVMHDQAEARAAGASVVHCSISRSPSELPNAAIGRRPMCSLMPTGLPALSSMKLISGSRNSVGAPSLHLEPRLDRRADDLLGRNAVDLLGPRPHELDAAARHDEGLEAVGAQIGEQFQHRLVDQLGVGPLEPRIARGREPVGDDLRRTRPWSCRRASPP